MQTISAIRVEDTKLEGKCNTKQVVLKKKVGVGEKKVDKHSKTWN